MKHPKAFFWVRFGHGQRPTLLGAIVVHIGLNVWLLCGVPIAVAIARVTVVASRGAVAVATRCEGARTTVPIG
jgi:hypothetical protein